MEPRKKVLVRINMDRIISIGSFGAEPKWCTGYLSEMNSVWIPMDDLLKQGFHIPDFYYENYFGMYIENNPVIAIPLDQVDILTSSE